MHKPMNLLPACVEPISLPDTLVSTEPAVRKPYLGESSSSFSLISVSSAPTTRILKPENPLTVNPDTLTPWTGFRTALTRTCSLTKGSKSSPDPVIQMPAWLGVSSSLGPAKLVHSFVSGNSGGSRVAPLSPMRVMSFVLIVSCSLYCPASTMMRLPRGADLIAFWIDRPDLTRIVLMLLLPLPWAGRDGQLGGKVEL